VACDRLVRFWKTAEELPGLVSLSLSKTIKMFPALGWVRANRAASEDLLHEINVLRKENAQLQKELVSLSREPIVALDNLAGLDESVAVHGKFHEGKYGYQPWTASLTWREIFGYISPYLLELP
jgi:hypothetical protein